MLPEGNTQGLKPGQLKALQKLPKRRFPKDEVYSHEQARELAALSRQIGRQIGLLIDRHGRVQLCLVGTASGLYIPELPRSRTGLERLRGLRLLHTHLSKELLSQEDLLDMLFLRLDAIIALSVDQEGFPLQWQMAHLLPNANSQQPYLVSEAKSWEQNSFAAKELAEALETELARVTETNLTTETIARALIVSVSDQPKIQQDRNLDELEMLADTAGIKVVGRMQCRMRQGLRRANQEYLIGKGRMADLEILALRTRAEMLIFDGELNPTQQIKLAEITERKVLDRTQLILDIFAQHAVSATGKLQVELAQLRYMQPRLVGKNRAMDRLMGGIGGRGPGETRLETDRRRVRDRIARLRKELEQLASQRSRNRDKRQRHNLTSIAILGYTNAGKSTLLNQLTNSHLLADNRLFATLDPGARRLILPDKEEVILVDTVGFIRNLPQELMEVFRATLEELEGASAFIHVADASHQDVILQIEAVNNILAELELDAIPCLLVFNKWDKLNDLAKLELLQLFPHACGVSALNATGLTELTKELALLLQNARLSPTIANLNYDYPTQ